MKSNRGEALTLIVIGGALLAAGALGGTLKLPAFLQKQPPTQALVQAQTELAKARAQQHEAEAKLEKLKADREQLTREAGQQAQGDIAGAQSALAAISDPSPEVKVAQQLVNRADSALEVAFGRMSKEAREEMKKLVNDALAAKGREIEALKASLADKDARIVEIATEKADLAAQVTKLDADVKVKAAEVETKAAHADTLSKEVVTYANEKADADKRAGSLEAYATWLLRTCVIAGLLLAAGYIGIHFALPSLAAEATAPSWIKRLNVYTKSLTSAHP